MPAASLRRIALLPLAFALLVAGCGSGGDDSSAPAGDDYEPRLQALVQQVTDDLNVARAPLNDAESLQEVVDAIVEAAPLIVDVIRGGLDRLEDLDPPARFADDHQRFVEAIREQVDVFEQLIDAAEDGDLGTLAELSPQAESIMARLEAAISPAFRALIAPFFGESGGVEETVLPEDAASGASAPPAGEPEEPLDDDVAQDLPEPDDETTDGSAANGDLTAYEAALRTIVAEVEASLDAATAEFEDDVLAAAVSIETQDEDEAFDAVVDVLNDFFPIVFALLNDGLERLEALNPPPEYAAEHALFLDAVRALADVPFDRLSDAEDVGALQALIADLTIQQDQIEASLRSGISPEFFALIGPFFDDDSTSASIEDGAGDEPSEIVVDAEDVSVALFEDLPDGFPGALVPAGGELEAASELESDGEVFTQATFVVTGDAEALEALLDSYESAFDDLGLTGARSRFAAAGFYTLDASGTGAIRHGTILISPGAAEGEWSVTVSLMTA